LNDFGVAQGDAVAPPLRPVSAVDVPSSSTNRTRLIVLTAVGFGLLMAVAAGWRLAVQRRRLVVPQPRRGQINGGRHPAGGGFFRGYGDRMRVAFGERGADVLLLGLGLAAAIALGALVAG
jgi:hypothetical protein